MLAPVQFVSRVDDADLSAVAALAETIPGLQVRGGQLLVPNNALTIAKALWPERAFQPVHRASSYAFTAERLKDFVPGFLLPYQKEGINRALQREGFSLHWSCGAGKTLAALSWSLALQPTNRVLFITRAAARGTIASEVARYTNVKSQILTGKEPRKRRVRVPGKRKRMKWDWTLVPEDQVFDPEASVFIIGYEVLPDWIDYLRNLRPEAVVFDELHRVKSWRRSAKRYNLDGSVSYEDLNNIASCAKKLSTLAKRRLGTTATPIRNRPMDLWAPLDLMEPWAWGSSYKFAVRYAAACPSPWGGLDTKGSSNEAELRERLERSTHVVPYEVTHASLPPKRRQVVRIPADELVKPEKMKGDEVPRSNIAFRLMQAASMKRGFVIDEVLECLRDGGKCCVFTALRADCDFIQSALQKALTKAKFEVPVHVAHGGIATTERDRLREEYMRASTAVLVGTIGAMGESINLQSTDVAIIAMLPWTPGEIEQLEGRVSRLGQDRPVLIKYLVAEGTADEHVANILIDKLPPVETLIQTGSVSGLARQLDIPQSDQEIADRLAAMIMAAESVD